MDDFICAEEKVHDKLVEDVDCSMPDEAVLCELSEFFRVFGDSTRIRILYALSRSEMCVCDLSKLLGVSQSAISHQLKILKQNKLVKGRRAGWSNTGGRAKPSFTLLTMSTYSLS